MFEESNQNATYTDRVFGRFKVICVELLADGTNWAVVAAGSSPGIATTANTVTIALTGLPKSANYWFPGVLDDVAGGSITANVTAQDAAAGTVTVTASAATNGARLKFFFLANRTG